MVLVHSIVDRIRHLQLTLGLTAITWLYGVNRIHFKYNKKYGKWGRWNSASESCLELSPLPQRIPPPCGVDSASAYYRYLLPATTIYVCCTAQLSSQAPPFRRSSHAPYLFPPERSVISFTRITVSLSPPPPPAPEVSPIQQTRLSFSSTPLQWPHKVGRQSPRSSHAGTRLGKHWARGATPWSRSVYI